VGWTSSHVPRPCSEAIYFEHKGKESGIVRFTFEMIEGLKIVEEEGEREDSTQGSARV
jgi:hypothetical protein